MYNYHNRKKFIWSVFLILLLVIGIGYAYLTSNLSISGNTNVSTNTWNIHFENLNVSTGSISTSSPATINAAGDAIIYTIDLNRPKEFYEFTVDVKNDGTLPGKLSISQISGLDTTSSKVIDYTITYTNGNPVGVGDILNAGAKKSIKVRVYYKDDITASDFPNSNLNLNLTYTLQYIQSEKDGLPELNETLINLASSNTCMNKYSGKITERVGVVTDSERTYFDECLDKRNIKFGGYCWQVIRTTETGGTKAVYNGEIVDGKCENNRADHLGIVGLNGTTTTLDSSYLYGNTFTYDTTNSTFTLVDTFTSTWSDSTYENLLGKYTCKSSTGTCSVLYNINNYLSSTEAYVASYAIGDTNYAQIGTSPFNADKRYLSASGYMYGPSNGELLLTSANSGEYKFGNSISYNSSTGNYTLSGTTKTISNWNSEYNTLYSTHYTCWNTSGICQNISYVYYVTSYSAYFVDLESGITISDYLNNMYDRTYNSSVKGIIDAWYRKNLLDKSNSFEDIVFCNSRKMKNSWDPNGGMAEYDSISFSTYNLDNNMVCERIKDQLSVSNNQAKLTYPVGLLSSPELNDVTSNVSYNVFGTGVTYWLLSPLHYGRSDGMANNRFSGSGGHSYQSVNTTLGVRPVISFKYNTKISSGSGSTTDPWVVE